MDVRIRQAIKERMAGKGITAADLARELDVSHQAVSQIISGERGKIPQSLMDVLAKLGMTLTVKEDEPEPKGNATARSGSNG